MVKSWGAVPNWKERSKDAASSFKPLVIARPWAVSNVLLFVFAWYCQKTHQYKNFYIGYNFYLISDTISIKVTTGESDIAGAVFLVQFHTCKICREYIIERL